MEMTTEIQSLESNWLDSIHSREILTPFGQKVVSITKQKYIEIISQVNYWKAQHTQSNKKIAQLEQELLLSKGKIKDLQKRLFGKKSEKKKSSKAEKNNSANSSNRPRGQQHNSAGHGRTPRPDLPVIDEFHDVEEDKKKCSQCGLGYIPNPALDEKSEIITVEVKAHTRCIHRLAYQRNPGCQCEGTVTILSAPPPDKLIPSGSYDIPFWVEIILGKYCYGQPTNRYLKDLSDQALPVSAGTVAGGLQTIAPIFTPIMEALYVKQMSEKLFHNDETRWEVFVDIEGKVGSRWYLWVTRSESVIFYCIDPSRSTAVPGAHFAGIQNDQVIIVCDRYSAYKKLARLSDAILLAYCWAHVRRDFLNAAISFKSLEPWALQWKEFIGTLYYLNQLRLAQWDPDISLVKQSDDFKQAHQALQELLQSMHNEAEKVVQQNKAKNREAGRKETSRLGIKSSAGKQQIKVYQSLLNHWEGLTLFMNNPQVPLDNNIAENSIRNPVTGRKAYYGSGSIWSAELAATLFSILQTLVLWNINPRHWLSAYFKACAKNRGRAPDNIKPFIPWEMDDDRKARLSRPEPP